MNYSVSAGLERDVIPAQLARAQWDLTPAEMRTGDREGAFILWSPSPHGWRGLPILFRPIRSTTEETAHA